jgi:ribosome biogenesis GTPase
MNDKLSKRQLRSLKKANEHKVHRSELKERRTQRNLLAATRQRPPPRQRSDWDEDDSPRPEKMRRAATRPPPTARVASAPQPEPPPEATGTVVEIRSGDSLVMLRGQIVRATLPPGVRATADGMRSPLAVGDRVELEPAGLGEARIVAIAPRRSALVRDVYDPSRRDAVARGHAMAANIDQVVLVCSPAEPPFRPRLVDRYLVAASRDGLPLVICLNKSDLGVPEEVAWRLAAYGERLGARVLRASALDGAGLDELRDCVRGRISIFTGHSGVGKSSLLNALEPGLALRVASVTEAAAGQRKGRHTTSSARLVPLSLPETYVVDTPGIRALGIRGLAPRELAQHFSELAALAARCAYRDCLHRGELGCAVEEAAALDAFLTGRLASYRALLAELS